MLDAQMQMERQVVAVKKALCFFLAIVFVCCVITHGKNERFSLEAFLNNITNFEDMPSMEDIMDVWTLEYYVEIEHVYHYPMDDEGNAVQGPPILEIVEHKIYYEDYEGGNEILLFFERIGAFFNRLFRTIKLIVEMLVTVFKNMKYLLPWNSTVPKGV